MTSHIKEFYKGQNILLTGGTGYFGKMIIEKLLRSTEVKNIYLIVRGKNDTDCEERVASILKSEIFANTDEKHFFSKVHGMDGNMTKLCVGLSKSNIEFIKNHINVVFHCGASLNMDNALADAVMTNVNGTAELLTVLKGSRELKALVLVSTAYSNCNNAVINETFYDPPIDHKLLINMAQNMDPTLLKSITPRLIQGWPNTYVFTKAVAENVLKTEGSNMPTAVFRPSIVTSTVSEPVPGWSDNLYGPMGILLSSNCGVLRVVKGRGCLKPDTVPGDMVVNALLCVPWEVNDEWNREKQNYVPPIYNFSGKDSPLYMSMSEYTSKVKNCGYPPFKKTIWSPMLAIVNNKYFFNALAFILHTLPGYLFDMMLIITGQKPRMRQIYQKLNKITTVLHFFLINEWTINNDNVKRLWEKLTPSDRAAFNFDLRTINVNTYFQNLMTGLKTYILKEDMTKAQVHKERYERLLILHNILKYVCMFLLTYPGLKKLWLLLIKPFAG
ncbi:fatty acyl-CoA reductase wat-like [Rhynchophorus ferrugineus]|uniref:Fatty acyl-CoA reductase n=1 Tax=Rhynchophorus ferrugineus TaxID=354439 RepID=A0A834ML47_RHYFE|nr:hypothetical protein GWI33_002785 [Rhynchophorus ferrugineus]